MQHTQSAGLSVGLGIDWRWGRRLRHRRRWLCRRRRRAIILVLAIQAVAVAVAAKLLADALVVRPRAVELVVRTLSVAIGQNGTLQRRATRGRESNVVQPDDAPHLTINI